jgi:hypothetical protein
MDDKTRGMYKKYDVSRMDGRPMGRAIVLEIDDPNSWPALLVWSLTVLAAGYEALAEDVTETVTDAIHSRPFT